VDENKPEVRSDIDQIYSAVMADTEALEDAKMTLEVIKKTDPGVYDEMIDDTLSLIRKALSNSILSVVDRLVDPDQEPIAWFTEDYKEDKSATTYSKEMAKRWKEKGWPVTPLYTAPQQRNWQGLTDAEAKRVFNDEHCNISADLAGILARAIEAKLKEKNT
jgi:hypothetical protein